MDKIKLNTTKILDFKLNNDFKSQFKIYKVIINEKDYSCFFKELNNVNNHISSFKYKDTVYILSNKILNIGEHRLKEVLYDEVTNHVMINLTLRALPYLVNKSIFSLTDNLTYFYSIKEGNIREYLAYDISISEKMVLSVNGTTYSCKKDLEKKIILLKNVNLLQKLKKRTVYFEDNGKILKIKNNKGEEINDSVSQLVKMKFGNSKNSTNAVSLDSSNYFSTKSGCLFHLMSEINLLTNYFIVDFETIEGSFVTRKSEKDKDMISRKNSDLDYTKYFNFFDNKIIGIINYSNDANSLKKIKEELDILKITNVVKLKDDGKTDFNIILSYNSEYYESKNIKDPYQDMMTLRNHFVNVDKHDLKNYKNVVPVILKELMIKSNLIKKELVVFGSEHDSTLINVSINIEEGLKIFEINGINIVNNKIKILDKEDIFNNSFIKNLFENNKLLDKLNDNTSFFIFSFGGICNELIFDNIYLVSALEEIAIPDVKMIGKKIDNNELLSRSMKNNGRNFPFAGVYGLFYNYKNNTIKYYIGSLNPQPQSKISKFCTLYNADIIKGNFSDEYFNFFEHFYVKNKDSTTLPFTAKYLREALKYINE